MAALAAAAPPIMLIILIPLRHLFSPATIHFDVTTYSLSLSLPQLLACCINASCLALMNAGLAMKCTVAAVRCVIIGESRRIVVDPSEKDVVGSDGVDQAAEFTFVFDSVERKAVSCHCSGRYSPEEFQEAMLAAQAASAEVFEFYRASLRKFIRIL